jgi:mannosyltransferase
MREARRGAWIGFGVVLLVACALRFARLDTRALWWDEGLTLFFAKLNFADNARYAVRLADTNPPFYRLLVGGWTALADTSAFSTRAFSALAGLVTVAAAMRLGRDWHGDGLALAAGGLAAASPMLVYFSQEAKAYSLVAACCAVATLIGWRMIRARRRRPRLWLGYGLALAVALGSHYITIFLIGVQAAWLAWAEIRRALAEGLGAERRNLLYFAAAFGLIGAAQLPYVMLTYAGTSAVVRDDSSMFVALQGPVDFFAAHGLEFAVGPGAKTEGLRGNRAIEGSEQADGVPSALNGARPETLLYWASALAVIGLAAGGLFGRETASGAASFPLYLLSLIALPLVAGFFLYSVHAFFFPRFLLFSVPPLLLLAAGGLAQAWQRGRGWRLGAAGLAALVGVSWLVYLAGYYAGPGEALQAEDWRPLAAEMRGHTRPGDAAVYGRGWMPGYLHAYLPPAPEPDYYLAHFTPESLDPAMGAILAAHSHIWLLDYQIGPFEAGNPAGRWLGERGALVYDEWFGNSHVALFMAGDSLPDPAAGEAGHAEFTNGLQLAWLSVEAQAQPGDAFALTLDWSAPPGHAPERRVTVFLHGLAADGSLAFGRDSEPGNGLRPTDGWGAGERVREWRGVLLPADLPPGEYALQAGLYDTLTGEPIPASDGQNAVALGRLSVP